MLPAILILSIPVGVKWYCGFTVYISFESYCTIIRWTVGVTGKTSPDSGLKIDLPLQGLSRGPWLSVMAYFMPLSVLHLHSTH